MDPNAILVDIRSFQAAINARANRRKASEESGRPVDYAALDLAQNIDREALVDLYTALDDWITMGGFLPDGWSMSR